MGREGYFHEATLMDHFQIEENRRRRKEENFDLVFEGLRWVSQIFTPILLALILWRVW
jgi:hypothetical protein